jgi:hypothetical protein
MSLLCKSAALAAAAAALLAPGRPSPPPFDFTDAFYLANGIEPSALLMRVGTPARTPADWAIDNSNTDPTRNNVRLLQTTGGFDASGNLIYYSIMGMVDPATFTADAAGRRARQIADAFRAFIFPKTQPDGSIILSPALANRRQDNVFDTRNGYLSNNPLGLWILAFVQYTPAAFTPAGQKILGPLAAKNGVDLDGTPILKSASDIDGLAAKGLVRIVNRDPRGSQGFPWVV